MWLQCFRMHDSSRGYTYRARYCGANFIRTFERLFVARLALHFIIIVYIAHGHVTRCS